MIKQGFDLQLCSLEDLTVILQDLKLPKYRAKQIYEWFHVHLAQTYDEMTNIPLDLRKTLSEKFPLAVPQIFHKALSSDGTRKYVFKLFDGSLIEAVGIPSYDEASHYLDVQSDSRHIKRITVCFSTQVGCSMRCAFCATGKECFTRNISASEMINQIISVQKDFGHRVSQVVAMGQGEPFLNYDNLIDALRFLNDQNGMAIGARHITVSTCGIIQGIQRFEHEPEQFTLAVSLHSAIQSTRDMLMPNLKSQSLDRLHDALVEYNNVAKRRITLEYLLIKDINDDERSLSALIEFCHGLHCHVNLLPMNNHEGSPFHGSSQQTFTHWTKELSQHGIETSLRRSRGSDINGACGQLKNSLIDS